jgi:hypothetical protein
LSDDGRGKTEDGPKRAGHYRESGGGRTDESVEEVLETVVGVRITVGVGTLIFAVLRKGGREGRGEGGRARLSHVGE